MGGAYARARVCACVFVCACRRAAALCLPRVRWFAASMSIIVHAHTLTVVDVCVCVRVAACCCATEAGLRRLGHPKLVVRGAAALPRPDLSNGGVSQSRWVGCVSVLCWLGLTDGAQGFGFAAYTERYKVLVVLRVVSLVPRWWAGTGGCSNGACCCCCGCCGCCG